MELIAPQLQHYNYCKKTFIQSVKQDYSNTPLIILQESLSNYFDSTVWPNISILNHDDIIIGYISSKPINRSITTIYFAHIKSLYLCDATEASLFAQIPIGNTILTPFSQDATLGKLDPLQFKYKVYQVPQGTL